MVAVIAAIGPATWAAETDARPPEPAPGVPQFDDVTAIVGLTAPDPAADVLKGAYIHAAAWSDVEDDGDLDLFVGTFTDSPPAYYQARGATEALANTLFLNDGRGRFVVADQPALAVRGRASGAVFADLDGDGDDDLVLSNNRRQAGAGPRVEPNHLFRNDGGTFVDVSPDSGIQPAGFLAGRAVGVLDHDADGCLDLYLVADGLTGYAGSSRLLRGDCAMHFADVTVAAGLASAQGDPVQGLGVAVADVDGDTLTDLFVAGGPPTKPRRNYLFRNAGDGTFTEVSGGTMFDRPPGRPRATEDWTSSASFGDLNRDGKLDLVVQHHFDSGRAGTPIKPSIYLNQSTAESVSFVDVTAATGVAGVASKTPHVELADLDNDGWLDIYVSVLVGAARQPLVYRHTGTLVDGVPRFASPPDLSAPDYYPGGPLADWDEDGRLDPFLEEFEPTAVPTLLRNTTTDTGNWVDVVIEDEAETDGIGATVRVYAKSGRDRTLLGALPMQVGNGFSSAGVPVVHLGLGSTRTIEIVVTSANGGEVASVNASANRRVRVRL